MTDAKPLWTPSADTIKNSRLAAFMTQAAKVSGKTFAGYADLWAWSVTEPAAFWNLAWDFLGVIGDKGAVVLPDIGEMRKRHFFPDSFLNSRKPPAQKGRQRRHRVLGGG